MSLAIPDLIDSPFVADTTLQYAWDSVSLTAAMACKRRYYYTIIKGLQPKGPGKAIALDFGIAFHKGMEFYNIHRAAGLDHDSATQATVLDLTANEHYAKLPTVEDLQVEAAEDDDDGIYTRNAKVRTRYHLIRAVVWYLDHYAADPMSTIILPSGAPAVEVSFRIPFPASIAGYDVLLVGHIDRAVEFNNQYLVSDYKTTKGLSRQFFADFELSHQLSGYSFAGSVIFDRPISGIVIDGIALQVGGVQFKRGIAKRTEGQIDEYIEAVQHTLDDVARCNETQHWPMNTSACYFCNFKELCSKPPEFRQHYEKMLFDSKPAWNPLKNR